MLPSSGKVQGDVAELRAFQVTIFRSDITEIRHQGELEWPKAHVPQRINALGRRLELTARRKRSVDARNFERRKRPLPHGKVTKIRILPGLSLVLSHDRNGS